jgi:hypothetical protein
MLESSMFVLVEAAMVLWTKYQKVGSKHCLVVAVAVIDDQFA